MIAAQIVALPYPGDSLREVCRSVTGPDEVRNNRSKSKVATLGTHQCNQCSGPFKDPGADRMALSRVRIEKRFGSPSFHRCGEFPAQVDCISDTKIKSLTADGCMNMSSVSR